MRVKLINIGNSKGIRIPKAVLQQVGWEHYAELEVTGDTLILRPVTNPRSGWDAAFQQDPPSAEEMDEAWLSFNDPDTLWDEAETW